MRTIAQDCTLDGVIDATIIVLGGVTVTISGEITQHLTMLAGSTVYLPGSVAGILSNQGGTLYLDGEVRGALELEGGKTVISAGSRIARIQGGRSGRKPIGAEYAAAGRKPGF